MTLPAPSDRLSFRAIDAGDLDFVAEMLGHPEVMRFYPKVYDRAEAQRWIEKQRKRYRDDGYGLWLLTRNTDGREIGQAGIVAQEFDGSVMPGLGYLLHRPYWRTGYATEAARACLHHGFEVLGFQRMVSLMRPRNERSLAVAARLGLRKTGSTRYAGYVHEVWTIDAPAT